MGQIILAVVVCVALYLALCLAIARLPRHFR